MKCVTEEKMRKVIINGNTYIAKRLFGVGVSSKEAVFVKHKEKLLFSKGFVVVWFENSPPKYYGVGEKQDIVLYYYNPDGGGDEIIFVDPKIQATWEKVFVLLYDEEGASFLTANKKIMSEMGAYCYIGNASHLREIKACAWNQAGLCDSELLERVRNLERLGTNLDEDVTLLEVDYER